MKLSTIFIMFVLSLFSISFINCEIGPNVKNKDKEELAQVQKKVENFSEEDELITVDLPGLVVDAVKLEMALIKPGTFLMGSPLTEKGKFYSDWPQHKVTITKPFYMGQFEVTQAHWEAVMGKESHRSKFKHKPNHPVEKVSWRECQKFIKKLNELDTGKFRLPTEAEWEYACRAGTNTKLFFDDNLENNSLNSKVANKYMWWRGNNSEKETKEVGQKLPNPWKLYDMYGNVCEWCEDRWEVAFQRNEQIDPTGPTSGSRALFIFTNRVFRGGGILDDLDKCRSSSRHYEQSFDYHFSLGLRLVREF